MRKWLVIILFFVNTACLYAADQNLFYYHIPEQGEAAGPGVYPIKLVEGLFEKPIGSELNLDIIGHLDYVIIHDNKIIHKNGDISWFGYLKGFHKSFRVHLIKGKNLIQGQIQTPEGVYKIRSQKAFVFLESIDEKGLIKAPSIQEDFLVPDPPVLEMRVKKIIIAASDDGSITTIDIMILYDQDMVDKYPGSQLETRINELVALSNQACTDSNVTINFRLVYSGFVNESNTSSNHDALYNMTDGTGSFFLVPSLRSRYGADLVIFLRPYNNSYHTSCGLAWLNGLNGRDISLDSDNGYCVVSEGRDGLYYCDDYTMVHEMGHNMGCCHDRDHTSSQGAYPYSYGHDAAGVNAFGTIMSYDGPTLGFFSNPDITKCNGLPCGISITQTNAANNALSLNNTRLRVAAFVKETDSSDTVNITGIDISTMSGPMINDPIMVTVSANNPGNQTLYYKFYYRAGYGTPSYDTSPWIVLQDYSTSNMASFTFTQAGSYSIGVRVVLDPNNEPVALPLIGQTITVGDQSEVFIRSMTHNLSTTATTNDTVTFSMSASTKAGETIYYKFFYRANYGVSSYDSTPWTVMQDYSTVNSCQYIFPSAGDYIIGVRAVTDPFNEPAALPISGFVIHVE
ncbi:MAG: hypothetical protein K8S13_23210 [Desulfobacula sp.]|uniref:M12 family metallo-peptidase n=1 Tax=Desulfobacula sp. TaxID=2593537 RepID=UPI0025C6982A|nr:M12 family metallo-peptidase [Desulfobacula sp.]MCD4722739.1 hypothetical protein [Desulfobacula sp.]